MVRWHLRTKLFVFLGISILSVIIVLNQNKQIRKWYVDMMRLSADTINFTEWSRNVTSLCSGNFKGYGHRFALLKNVVLDPSNALFQIPCDQSKPLSYSFLYGKEGTHLNDWMASVSSYEKQAYNEMPVVDKFVIAVLRYEYANMYHTMTDWYNAFFIMKAFNKTADTVSVLFFSRHAAGALDKTWTTLFSEVKFKPDLKDTVKYKEMAWSILGYESPVNHHMLTKLPFMQDFHNFFLQRHGIAGTKLLNCKKLRIMFLWRRDYVAHPGNPSGLVSRKVKNEKQLIEHLTSHHPEDEVIGEQLDQLDMKDQLELITQTDILISMHGAGLSHILFLPSHAGVVEMFPLYWLNIGFYHFQAMARWRGIKHVSWQNYNPTNEHAQYNTHIPPYVVGNLVQQLRQQICPL